MIDPMVAAMVFFNFKSILLNSLPFKSSLMSFIDQTQQLFLQLLPDLVTDDKPGLIRQ
jgi:hypothetical protein